MNLGSISDKLPTYPPNIQGELRLILQTKDIFMVCYKQLEEYRRLVNEQNRLITKEFVQEQLQVGEDEIAELKMELTEAESKLAARLRHNELLADQLSSQGFTSLEGGGTVRHMALARSPHMRKQMLAQRKSNADNNCVRSQTHMIDNIALAIDEIHQEVRTKVKPLLDYYRDLFYLQLHFSLILGQVCNYCMPLVTENIGLLERVFFWAERPEFELIRKASDISDRLKEIYTRAQQIFGVLSESVRFLQSKVELQKSLETRFHERMDEQQKIKDKVLREIHGSKQNMDMLEEENDRLVGSLVKLDPTFVDSQQFIELAEGGNMPVKPNTGAHNIRQGSEDARSTSPISPKKNLDDLRPLKSDSNLSENSNVNASYDYNNNKALSVMTDIDDCFPKPVTYRKQKNLNHRKCPKQDKKKDPKFIEDNVKVETEHEGSLRSRKKNATYQKKTKRAITAEVKERTLSSGNETRESRQNRRRSSSRIRSPSAPSSNRKRSNHSIKRKQSPAFYDTVSEGQATEGFKQKTDRKEMNILSSKHQSIPKPSATLKSRLLDRTKGLFESSKVKNKSIFTTSGESEDSSVIGHAYQQPMDIEGDAALTSVSSFDSTYLPDVSTTHDQEDKLRAASAKSAGKKNKRNIEMRKTKRGETRNSGLEKIPVLDENVLVLNNQSNESNSVPIQRKRSKSHHGSRNNRRNELADFLTSSASDNLSSVQNSVLPNF